MSVEEEVLQRIRPSQELRKRIEHAVESLMEAINSEIEAMKASGKLDYDIQPMLVGSVAKDTYDDEPDIDIFLRFPLDTPLPELETIGLRIGHSVLPDGQEKYAQHPYVTGRFMDFDVDIVPAYGISSPEERRTAVDRTPLHTQFVMEHLAEEQKDQVRLLKRFFKGIGVYGAEARIQGFSGYLTELLVIKFSTFRGVLKFFSRFRPHRVLHLGNRGEKKFNDPMIFIDPVDPWRNVASVVSVRTLAITILASRQYLNGEDIRFFFPNKRRTHGVDILQNIMARRTSRIVRININRPQDVIDDNLHDQCRKTLSTLVRWLRNSGYYILSGDFTYDDTSVYFAIEYSMPSPLGVEYHRGPVYFSPRIERFFEKHISNPEGLRPFIDDGIMAVYMPRKMTEIDEIISVALEEGKIGKNIKDVVQAHGFKIVHGLDGAGEIELRMITDMVDWIPPWMVDG